MRENRISIRALMVLAAELGAEHFTAFEIRFS